jgi:hypothetical protein
MAVDLKAWMRNTTENLQRAMRKAGASGETIEEVLEALAQWWACAIRDLGIDETRAPDEVLPTLIVRLEAMEKRLIYCMPRED